MILGALAAASLLFSVNAFAQENANRDENGKIVRGAYETNRAFDNTWIGLAAGWNAGLNLQNTSGIPFAQGIGGLAVDVSLGKWWTPFIGGRINWLGLANNVLGNDGAPLNPAQHFITGDLLWSLTDTFWGYKETRVWNVAPYVSGGLAITPVVIPVPFTTEQYNALADKVAALEKENAELKDKIAALEEEVAPLRQLTDGQTYLYENGKFTAVDVKPGSPITLYFDCGSAKLSEREKAHFEYFANTVVDENSKLAVNGYADKQTGSAKRNQQLSEQRVKTVVDLLLKAGAKEENIESAAHGATVQLFDGAAKNRVVTVELQ